ncbi:MAG: oligosaccharide flippase family protein, partial [Bacillota bacterium]|nr:oligosaccharide flippase family protein [Bacillota bacterium]
MKESIVFGTVILIVTNFFVKILSLVYRGVLIRLIGGEGLGLWEMISPIFSLILVVASWGIPLAISNLVSRDIGQNHTMSIVKTGMILLTFTGLTVSVVVLLIFPFVKDMIFPDTRIYMGFLATIPTVLIISFFSVYRGYFQGSHMTSLLGKSQAVEQIVRVVAGIAIVVLFIDRGYTITILLAGLSAATFFAEWSGGLYLWQKFRKEKKTAPSKGVFHKKIAHDMLKMGTPITMSRLATSFAMSCQAILVPKALIAGGCSPSMAATLFGYFSGVAVTVLHLPAIITNALTTPLIPAIAEAAAENAREKMKCRIEDSLLFTSYTAI